MANTLSRAILCAALLALPVSAQAVGVVDERSLEWDDSGVVVRASGDLVVGDVTVGRFVLKLPRSDEPVQRGTVSLHLEGFGAGSLKGTFEQRFRPPSLGPAADAASRAFARSDGLVRPWAGVGYSSAKAPTCSWNRSKMPSTCCVGHLRMSLPAARA